MVFSSTIFLFLFLPLVLLGHFIVGKQVRNLLLLSASLIFYAWGEGVYVLVMLGSILANFVFGRLLDSTFQVRFKKWLLAIMLMLNLLPLLYFKYLIFLVTNLNEFLLPLNWQLTVPENIRLPIGISFFTFQAMSYLIDIYRYTSRSQRSIFDVGLYIALFPQLIAGPIVRYHDISEQIKSRVLSRPLFASGIERFIFGLGKKMLIANPMGYMADTIFAFPPDELGFMTAWLGIICYALQIYFDFSGYSDMAIGLGRMFGFKFLENFNYPYVSRSIREFWRRWHISLSGWFRDYLYIPLGGNRHGNFRTIFNLLLVFLVCGLWHGASWNFVIWGMLHGIFLALERSRFGHVIESSPKILQHLYVLIVVLTAWVFFRAETLDYSVAYLAEMYKWPVDLGIHPAVAILLDTEFYAVIIIGLVFSTPLYAYTLNKYKLLADRSRCCIGLDEVFKLPLLILVFSFSTMEVASGAYNPFIYFRF